MIKSKLTGTVALLFSLIPFSIVASAEERQSQTDIFETRAVGLRQGQTEEAMAENTIHEHVRSLCRMYDSFISFENHPKENEKLNRTIKGVAGGAARREWIVPGVRVSRETTLREAMEELKQHAGGAYEAREISGQVCLLPAESGSVIASPLDKKISFACSNLSTEAAFLELIKRYNEQHPEEVISVQTNAEMSLARMPTSYYDDKVISLDFRDFPMREAICKLMYLAPIRMYYNFHTKQEQRGLSTHLLILCTNYKVPEEMVKAKEKVNDR